VQFGSPQPLPPLICLCKRGLVLMFYKKEEFVIFEIYSTQTFK
jgi:hypothetical protein